MGPFVATFVIAMFFLVMQFLWRYIDDLIGKGLDFLTIGEFLFYVAFNLVPMALPLAILLSSLMTFGALGENNELTALKSSGLSLFKIMRPITYFVVIVCIGAFYFANYAWPWSNLKWKTLYWEILESKPAFQVSEKVFYNEIPNFSIRVEKKSDDGKILNDVIIYDYSGANQNRKRDVKSEQGQILKSKNPNYMLLSLDNGVIYEEMSHSRETRGAVYPFRTIYFEKANLKFDVSGFKLSRGNEGLFKDSPEMLSIFQLNTVIDSMEKTIQGRVNDYSNDLKRHHLILRSIEKKPHPTLPDSITQKNETLVQQNTPLPIENNLQNISTGPVKTRNQYAIELCQNSIRILENSIAENNMRRETINRFYIEWHRKFTLPYACLVIFFIGASLGSIVRKGGLGTPLVISVLLFLLYHILTMIGEKMAKSGSVDPFVGMWFSAFILTPLSLYLTRLAAKESSLVSLQTYTGIFKRIFIRKVRKAKA